MRGGNLKRSLAGSQLTARPRSGGSPREGAWSELASGAATGGGGRSAPDPEHVELDRPRMRGGTSKPSPDPEHVELDRPRTRGGHLKCSPDPKTPEHEKLRFVMVVSV